MTGRPAVRALVVDDTPLNLKLMSALLIGNGFAVQTAETAEQAAEVLATGSFDLLLLDVRLPGMDGLTFARALRTNPRQTGLVIVAVTAHAMKSDQEAALAAGCDAFVTKPINTRTLVPLIDELLARGRVS